MVVRGYQVTDIMKEGTDHQFLIAPVTVGHGRRLQTMAVVVHLVPETLDMLLGPQKAQGLLRLVFAVEILLLPGKQGPVFGGEILHRRLCLFHLMPAWRGHRGGLVQFPVTREPVLNFFPVAESRCGIPVPHDHAFLEKNRSRVSMLKGKTLTPETASSWPAGIRL